MLLGEIRSFLDLKVGIALKNVVREVPTGVLRTLSAKVPEIEAAVVPANSACITRSRFHDDMAATFMTSSLGNGTLCA